MYETRLWSGVGGQNSGHSYNIFLLSLLSWRKTIFDTASSVFKGSRVCAITIYTVVRTTTIIYVVYLNIRTENNARTETIGAGA